MKFYLGLCIVLLFQASAVLAQEELLGRSRDEARQMVTKKEGKLLADKQYPLIKETLELDEVQMDGASRAYLFVDSSDRVCRVHLVYDDLTLPQKQKMAENLASMINSKQDVADKKHMTYLGRTKNADYILTWSRDKNRKAAYLLVTANDYKHRMLNYLVNGGTLPDDGIFTPAPSK